MCLMMEAMGAVSFLLVACVTMVRPVLLRYYRAAHTRRGALKLAVDEGLEMDALVAQSS